MTERNHHPRRWQKLWQRCLVAIAALLLLCPLPMGAALATSIFDIPGIEAGSSPWVIDQGDVLSLLNKGAIEKKLSKLAEKTGAEVRFVTIRRFDYGETADTFSEQLFERWFPTPEAQSNQGLLLLDTKTNTTSIRTGSQLKTLLTDDIAESIATETTLVPIRDGNYNQGLLDATSRLELVLSGEPDPGPPEVKVAEVESTFKKAEETDDRSAAVLVIVLVVAASVIPMATYYWYQRG